MKIIPLKTGFFKLDGGAMFGIIPKQMWSKKQPADENNLCTWEARCLLLDMGDRKVLIDTGLGNKFDDRFRRHFEPHGTANLRNSLSEHGYSFADITDVLFTHLHFDHAGGATHYTEDGVLVPSFPNATYWTNQRHYDWAMNPNPREAASYLKENFVPLLQQGVLKMIDFPDGALETEWLPGIRLRLVFGHTEAMMVPIIETADSRLIHCADVIPSSFHLGVPWVMGYDLRPLATMQEKQDLIDMAINEGFKFFFEHDPYISIAEIQLNERGRPVLKN